ncbi:MAG: hypothetical protein QNK04_33775 [Myxococcota bacterium]|nr:hypothetical protein [Myxococcota bacterium]
MPTSDEDEWQIGGLRLPPSAIRIGGRRYPTPAILGDEGMKRTPFFLLALLLSAPVSADTGFQLAAAGARTPDDPNVSGFRLSLLYGENEKMGGLDLGLLSLSSSRNRSGAAIIAGISRTKGRSSGLNSALIITHEGEATGVNASFINIVKTLKSGLNIGFLNITEGFSSADLSGLGISDRSNVQVGFVNVTRKIEKFQFGFLNIAENGFLPVFPIVNFPKSSSP